jgi:hypothetical protein
MRLTRLYGNYSGLASSDEAGRTSPGVNRFFDLPHLGFTAAAVLFGRGNLGRTPVMTQTDFSFTHRYRITERYALAFDFNVINLFNEANVMGVQSNVNAINPSIASLKLPVADEPEALNYVLTKGIINEFNAFLNDPANPQRKQTAVGMGNSFQSGRGARLGVRFTF